MPQLLVRNAQILDTAGPSPTPMDIGIDAGRITFVREAGAETDPDALSVDARGGLVTPGFVDAHVHSHEYFMRGLVWGVPLEPYIPRIVPRLRADEVLSPEDVYIRTLVVAAELLRGGVTSVLDDVAPELLQQQYVDAILGAYSDAGIRARVSILHETKPWTTSVAFLARHLSTAQRQLLEATTGTADADHVARLYEATASQWQGHARVGPVVSPSALQRVSDEHLTRLYDIAERFDLPFHVHIQETFTQALDGPGRYGTSMIAHASSLGILSDRTSVAHGIWLTDDDIDILARTRATVIHNPASNLKLGSGVARVKELLSASVNVGLGCDGYTCNDAQDLIEAMKLASLLSSVASEDPQLWIGPEDALRMATQGGATAVGLRGHGRIVPGVAADLVIFNAETPALRPMNAPAGQLVYCAKRSDVRSVVVDGHLVVADGVVQALDETALLDDIEAVNSRFWRGARRSFDENRMLEPAFAAAYADAQARIAEISNLRLIEGDRPRMLRV